MACGHEEVYGGAGIVPGGLSAAGLSGLLTISIDSVNPEIKNFVPAIGSVIGRTDYVQFDVTDDTSEFTIIFVIASFPDGSCECVWDGDSFRPRYLAGSSRVPIECGFRFTIRRTGGWPSASILVETTAIDRGCNVGVGVFS